VSYLNINKVNTFYGHSHILFDLSMGIGKRETVCLLGRNGAGKTTTIKAIMGLLTPQSGTIDFDGKKITNLPAYSHFDQGIGYVPQGRRIFPNLTVQENFEIAYRERRGNEWTIERAYDTFSILKKLSKRMGNTLSGGELQMLAIARALVGNPDLVLLDEPCEGLAPLIVQDVAKVIEEIRGAVTILLAEQNVRFALMHADRAYIIDDGRMKYQGYVEELRNNEEIKSKYLAV